MAVTTFLQKWTRSVCVRCHREFPHKRKTVRRWCSQGCAAKARAKATKAKAKALAYRQVH